jgi:hypothetical protein
VVAKDRERLSANKQAKDAFDVEIFNLENANYLEGRENFLVKIRNIHCFGKYYVRHKA